tara:strand:- start:2168 stop:4054 length:1887 start_codon:yes stop_codon:yes gene_type:complete
MIFNNIGYYSLVFGLFTSIYLLFFSFFLYIKGKSNNDLNLNIYHFSLIQLFLVIFSFICLILCFILSDFSNETVYYNSHTTKPIFYKIAGAWGNHEGSLLLWLLVLTLFIFLFIIKSKSQPKKYRLLSIFFQQIIITGFFLFLLITSNPFNYLSPIPEEGLGLNPILQDPALVIHPPILYLGYVGSSIIFSSSLAALIENNLGTIWAKHIKNWVFLSWIFLTLGILLGSIWAYYELGWGGFWFWDPVENVSLMPWFSLTALLHTISVLEKRQLLKSWTIILSISTFSLSMSGTFLVRSGILNSVHTFASDPERGVFILIFLFLLIFLAIFVFFFFSKNIEQVKGRNFYWLSKDASILINNWFMMYFLSVVLIGTVYPIFLEVITSDKISIGPPFYNKLLIPFLIPFLVIMSFGPKLKWIKDRFEMLKLNRILFFFISLFISIFIYEKLGKNNLLISILILAGIYLFFISLIDFFKSKNNLSQNISHFGFSLLILSIILNSFFSSEFSSNMKVGDKIEFENKIIKFSKVESKKGSNYNSIVANFTIEDKNKRVINFFPEIRIYNQPNIMTSEADIKTSIFYDKFFVVNLLKNESYFNVRYQVKSFMIWIWISTLLIALGGLIGLLKKIK